MESVLILTPLAIEHAALSGALCSKGGAPEADHNGVKVINMGGLNLDLAVGGHGKVQFALSTQLLIQKLNPRLVICAGAAGRLAPELTQLDVVVGEVTIEHDFRLRFIDRPLPRFPGDMKSLEKIKRQSTWNGFQVFYGPLASGDEDIIDDGRASEIRNATGAVAVAWEGAGGARACRLHGVPYVEIRAITDSADGDAARAFAENVKFGMRNVAEVIRQLI
ncbi:MAG: 5'-methylthioadenosine/S-adenosylhomocysteine nucleosidase [Bdellovibrionales bacterium]